MTESFWQTPIGVALIAALSGAIVTAIGLFSNPLRHYLDKRFLSYRLTKEYEFEQKKSLRTLIGRYHGRLVHAASEFSSRVQNLYLNEDKGWLSQNGQYQQSGYYFQSFVQRFLAVCALASSFEREAVVIDARIAEPQDGEFLRYCRAMLRVVTDGDLFAGLGYNYSTARDHVFSGTLEAAGRAYHGEGDIASQPRGLNAILASDGSIDVEQICRFFDGLNKSENRLRWDRLVSLHLVVLGFLTRFGYEIYLPKPGESTNARNEFKNQEVATNLRVLLVDSGFSQTDMEMLVPNRQ